MTLTPRDIEDRFEEAAYTLRRLPEKDRPRGYGGSWPSVVQEAKHAYGYTPEAPMRVIPSAAAITRMEECFDWLMLIHPEDARIVWLRADGMRWRQVCIRAGVVRSNGIARGSSGTFSLRFDFVCEFSFFAIVKRAAAQRRQAVDRTRPARMQTCRQRMPSARSQTMRASSGWISINQSKHSSIRVIAAALGITRIGASGV